MIQRYFASPYIDLNGMGNVTTEPYSDGDLVYFADHEAEVSALRAQLAAAEANTKLEAICIAIRQRNDAVAQLAAAHARIGRLRRLYGTMRKPLWQNDKRRSDYERFRKDCLEHNDLTPPTAEGASDE
jgi:hypothetical protein